MQHTRLLLEAYLGDFVLVFKVGSEAFADDEDDPQIVRAIERGSELRVESVSARGTSVAYHFSLSGSADAISRAASACR